MLGILLQNLFIHKTDVISKFGLIYAVRWDKGTITFIVNTSFVSLPKTFSFVK